MKLLIKKEWKLTVTPVPLLFLLLGALGTNILPAAYFGIPERFSVFAATGFNAVLGLGLYRGLEVFSGHELV